MKWFRGILSLAMAISLILSTIGFSVSRHYCLGMLAEESFFHLGDESCGMEDHGLSDCGEEANFTDYDCCADDNLSIPGLQIQNRDRSEASVSISDRTLPNDSYYQATNSWTALDSNLADLANAPPDTNPKAIHNILILQQRFLI